MDNLELVLKIENLLKKIFILLQNCYKSFLFVLLLIITKFLEKITINLGGSLPIFGKLIIEKKGINYKCKYIKK